MLAESPPKEISYLWVLLALFILFFAICMGLGYAPLNRYVPSELAALRDLVYYENIVVNGILNIKVEYQTTDLTSRILMPYMAHLVYDILPELGTWNRANLALLLIGSAFTALTAILIFHLSLKHCRNSFVGLLASFLFLSSYEVTNTYLIGSVESVYGFFLLLLLYVLHTEKWLLILPIAILGTLAKETFFIVGLSTIFGWLLVDFFETRILSFTKIILSIAFGLLSLATIVVLNFAIHDYLFSTLSALDFLNFITHKLGVADSIQEPWNGNTNHFSNSLHDFFSAILKFSFSIGTLLLLSAFSIRKVASRVIGGSIAPIVAVVLLGFFLGISGFTYARFIHTSASFILCYAAATTIIHIFDNYLEREPRELRDP